MNKFAPEDIEYFQQRGEEEYCISNNMLVDRYVIPIQADTYLYAVPEYCYNIRRLTYKGKQLNPFSGKEQIWSDSTPTNYIGGEPREYIYNYYGKKQIRLFPTPQETLRTDLDPWSGDGIAEQMILSFYRTPDFTTEDFRIPAWIRGQFLDTYVFKEISKMDSTNFDIKTIKGFESMYQTDVMDMKYIFQKVFSAIDPLMEPFGVSSRNLPGKPVLPWNFGYVVED